MSDPQDELASRFEERAPDSDNTDDTDNSDDVNNTNNANNTSSKPGPDPDDDATRNRKQVPMYLSEERADLINGLYERLDGRSKVAGDGGIEKHRDFMSAVVDLAVENEDELADQLGINQE